MIFMFLEVSSIDVDLPHSSHADNMGSFWTTVTISHWLFFIQPSASSVFTF